VRSNPLKIIINVVGDYAFSGDSALYINNDVIGSKEKSWDLKTFKEEKLSSI